MVSSVRTYLVCVTVLELEVNLIGRAVTEGILRRGIYHQFREHNGSGGYLSTTFCSEGPAPMTKTFPPNTTDWKDISKAYRHAQWGHTYIDSSSN